MVQAATGISGKGLAAADEVDQDLDEHADRYYKHYDGHCTALPAGLCNFRTAPRLVAAKNV